MSLAVFPQHLRPAKYDAARLTYMEHMTVSVSCAKQAPRNCQAAAWNEIYNSDGDW